MFLARWANDFGPAATAIRNKVCFIALKTQSTSAVQPPDPDEMPLVVHIVNPYNT
jgi:hypothetical protein